MKSILSEMKNALNVIIGRLYITDEKISEFEDTAIEFI